MTTEKSEVFLMTSKSETKDCPCTHVGCFNICRVNRFYAPKKAKCPRHGGKAMVRKIGLAEGKIDFQSIEPELIETVEVEVTPNYKIRLLMCPICDTDESLEILACTDDGYIDFGCQGCQTVVSVMLNFRSAQLRSIPKALRKVVKEFNITQVGSMDASVMPELSGFGQYRTN